MSFDRNDNGEFLGDVEAPPRRDEVKDHIARQNAFSRLIMVITIAILFFFLNGLVAWLIHDAYSDDIRLMMVTPPILKPSDRLITTEVIMSLIGATVIQVGIAIVSIVNYLFPKNGNKESP